GDDRGHRHDVAEHGHQRSELGAPDRVERDEDGLDELVHFFLSSILTCAPSASPRTELYGPVITWSPGLRPDSTSKYLSPATPILIGTNSARVSRTTKTPST